MHTKVLVVGAGLAGTWVSYWLWQAGIPFLVLETQSPGASTPVASGVINPVTGRRLGTTWMADTLLPFAYQAYSDMGKMLGQELAFQTQIIDCFGAPDKRLVFMQKAAEPSPYLQIPADENDLRPWLQYHMGYGIVSPGYRVHLTAMLGGWQHFLRANDLLIAVDDAQKVAPEGNNLTSLAGISAEKIIYCNGKWAAESGLFQYLPFSLIKGEALLVRLNDNTLPAAIYKKGYTLLPWQDDMWWAGSTYDRNFSDALPTAGFRQAMEQWLRGFLRSTFTIVDHLASIRPGTVERRPFIGWHPRHPQIGLVNGLGTKGVSLAPFFAHQMVASLSGANAIDAEADLARYSRLLSR